MAERAAKYRLHVDAALAVGAAVALSQGQAHYLGTVLRLGPGATVLLFNGRDGEWRAEIAELSRRGGVAVAVAETRAQTAPPDIELLFAPLKKARLDMLVEKATELGAARLRPVLTRRTNAERVRTDRLRAQAVEAAEQCGALSVPEIAEPARLDALLAGWDPARALHFCNERLAGAAPGPFAPPPAALLIGPEGGFDAEEAEALRRHGFVHPIALGPRILRAETAAIAALTLWQAAVGDWRGGA
ncbi:MAG: 16S rRNA (uracil(1498)-N(3))-methyltransferase [Pseudomonadota bacterium]